MTSAAADAQQRRSGSRPPVEFDLTRIAARPTTSERINFNPTRPGPRTPPGLLETWSLGGMQVGVGRYAVAPIVRPRTHTERSAWGVEPPRGSAIAGAGLSMPF